ncbi:hypothetical protein [Actinophytocola sp.]|jgi:hypothetical protein|uniref:hypothetical protein n=1 Tax=Actinophytocola sp. TaxID=1872138 RepID=UPI002EDAE9A3
MTDPEPLHRLAAHLGEHRVTTSTLFGKPALKDEAGKTFACLLDGEVAFRLGRDSEAHAEALGLAGAHLFDPAGKDRPMKDWVSVPPAHAARWPQLAELALAAPR